MLTPRIEQLKKQFFTHVPAVCLEGALSKTHVFKETEGEPMIVRRAKAFKRHCETKTITIQPGDRVLSIDGKPIENWNAVAEGIGAGNGKAVTIVLSRGGSEVTLSLTPEAKTRANIFGEEKPAWLIGIRASTATGHLPLGPVEAIGAGFRQTWDMIAFTCESFVKLAQRVVPLDNVGGPILIAQMVGQQAEQGLSAVLLLAALISVNLGILNLLPIPILDGGHIVFFTLEMIMGRPVSATAREWSAKVGMALLLGLMILATWNDLTRLFS